MTNVRILAEVLNDVADVPQAHSGAVMPGTRANEKQHRKRADDTSKAGKCIPDLYFDVSQEERKRR